MSSKDTKSYLDGDIPVVLWKKILPLICEPLSNLINASFEQGIFPDILKYSKITPIFKKGDRSLTNSYRPISITHNISKLMEKLVLVRLNNFFTRYNILDKNNLVSRKIVALKTPLPYSSPQYITILTIKS